MECFKCGVSGEREKLFDAISNTGIVKVCARCAAMERIPIIRKPTTEQITEAQRHKSVQERLTGMNRNRLKTEVTLRDLVDRDLRAKKAQSNPSDLVENFHWTIQRIRRARKITREEFAKGIGESESTVRMIEQGFLPENNYKIIAKIESFLRISLRKPGTSEFSQKPFVLDNSLISESDKKLAFDEQSARNLKIADLKEMDKKVDKAQRGLFSFFGKKRAEEKKKEPAEMDEDISQDDEKFLDENFEEE